MVNLEGIMPAIYTGYDENGEVTTKDLDRRVGFLLEAGCNGFFVGGSSGEGLLQTVEERCKFLEAMVKTVSGQVPVLAHVGALSTRDACEIARFAAKIGADGVGSVLPFYYEVGPDGAAQYYREISEASGLPLLIYYLEMVAGAPLDPRTFAEKLATIPGVFALKYTAPDIGCFRNVIDLTEGRLQMVMGCDQILLPGLTMGAQAGIGSTYNFMPELYVAIYNNYCQGDIKKAEEFMHRAAHMVRIMHGYPLLQTGRALAKIRGFDLGQSRGPLIPMGEEDLKKFLDEIGPLEQYFNPNSV